MSRETVRMVRLGIRPEVETGAEDQTVVLRADMLAVERARYEARIAELERDLAIANKALAQLMAPKAERYECPWAEDNDGEG